LSRFVQYDIDDYNCTDWALDVFNSTVKPSENLDIPRYDIPGGHAYRGSGTPQGVYLKLQEMKNAGVLRFKYLNTFGGMGWRK